MSAYPAREDFAADFTKRALRTLRLVKLFEDKDMGIRPGDGSMTTAEQINHVCASQNFLRGVLTESVIKNDWFMRSYDVSTADAAVASLIGSIREVQSAAEDIIPELWDEIVEPWGPILRVSRGQLAYLMIEHEVHHTGSLHVYARAAGKVPAMLYHPVEESLLQDIHVQGPGAGATV